MWRKAHAWSPSLEELQACFRLRTPNKTRGSYYPYSSRGRLLQKEYKKKRWASWWLFLGGAWDAPMGEGEQLVGRVSCKLYIPRWSGDFVTPLKEVV